MLTNKKALHLRGIHLFLNKWALPLLKVLEILLTFISFNIFNFLRFFVVILAYYKKIDRILSLILIIINNVEIIYPYFLFYLSFWLPIIMVNVQTQNNNIK